VGEHRVERFFAIPVIVAALLVIPVIMIDDAIGRSALWAA